MRARRAFGLIVLVALAAIATGCQPERPRPPPPEPPAVITSAVRAGDGAYHLIVDGAHVRVGPASTSEEWPALADRTPLAERVLDGGLELPDGAPLALQRGDEPFIRAVGSALVVEDADGPTLVGRLRAGPGRRTHAPPHHGSSAAPAGLQVLAVALAQGLAQVALALLRAR